MEIQILEPIEIKPYYELVLSYGLGYGANYNMVQGETKIYAENPHTARVVTLLKSLIGTPVGSKEVIEHLPDDDKEFLNVCLYQYLASDVYKPSEDKYLHQFFSAIRRYQNWKVGQRLTLNEVDLYYIDNMGVKHKTQIS